MSVEVIKEGAFGGTYFRNIYSGINGKWYRKSWKKFDQLEGIDQKYYCSDYYDVSVNKYGVKCRTLFRFWENKGWINKIDHYGWFQWYFRYWLGRRLEDDERQVNRWKRIVSRCRGKLVKMIKQTGSKFDDYSILPKTRQILLHWGYELTEKAKEIYSKNKAAEYYSQNKESIKKTSKIKTKTCHIQKITRLKSTKEKDISY